MKKTLSLILMLAVLMVAPAFASAELAEPDETAAEAEPDLFDLWDYGGESPVWVSFAIPVSEGIVMAPGTVKDIPADRLAVTDGEQAWEAAAVLPDGNDQLTYVFFDTREQKQTLGSWELLPWGSSVPASSCTVRFGDALGSRINRGVLAAEEFRRNGERFLLLDLTDAAPVGSPVLTSDGLLAGVVTAQWAEGLNRVVVMPAEGIALSVTSAGELISNLPEWSDPPQGLDVTMNKNSVTISWKGMALPEKPAGSEVYIVVVDTGNSYLTSYPAEGNGRKLTMLLTPGRFYIAGPVVSEGRPGSLPGSYVSFYLPKAEQLTEYSFTPVVTAVAEAPEGGLQNGEAPVPVAEVTEELLRSGRAYFYSHSTYTVTEKIEGKTLLVTLTDPAGVNYRYESSWMYAPEYMAEDIWYLPLAETGLTESLNAGGYPKGVYRMAYYVDGFLADEFSFELK